MPVVIVNSNISWMPVWRNPNDSYTGTLERNQHITLAHVNPEGFAPMIAEPGKNCSMWFIGLLFAKSENLNVDLTYDIRSFAETSKIAYFTKKKFFKSMHGCKIMLTSVVSVERNAVQNKVWKEGMGIEAKHVKRKDLHTYVTPSLLKRERKVTWRLIAKKARK